MQERTEINTLSSDFSLGTQYFSKCRGVVPSKDLNVIVESVIFVKFLYNSSVAADRPYGCSFNYSLRYKSIFMLLLILIHTLGYLIIDCVFY